jgi:hypothetical protein
VLGQRTAPHPFSVAAGRDRKLHVSKIAWLLGFSEVSAFTHAFKPIFYTLRGGL